MKKRKRRTSAKKNASSSSGIGWIIFILLAVAVVAAAVFYSQRYPDQARELKSSVGKRFDEFKEIFQEKLEITESRDSAHEPAASPHPSDSASRFYTYAGFPRSTAYPYPVLVLTNQGFALGYCETRKNPAWVTYRVSNLVPHESYSRPTRFLVDERTQSRVGHNDYTGTGYDRGHMAPNFAIVTRYGRDAQVETFLMSNIVPQKPVSGGMIPDEKRRFEIGVLPW